MKIKFEKNKYTTEYILDNIGEERIYNYFLGESIDNTNAHKCCFHEDKTPSLRFKEMKSGQIIYHCFGCGAKGDVFNFVQNLHKIPFKEAVKLIIDTFEYDKTPYIHKKTFNVDKESTTQIMPYFKKFTDLELKYWKAYHITIETLQKYNVYSTSKVFLFNNSQLELNTTKDNPIFAYKFGKDIYKIYRPLNPSKKGKFFSNVSSMDIQGLAQLPSKGKRLFITSSLKDVMVLHELGYNAVAPQGEGIAIPDSILEYLFAIFDEIIVFYDSDDVGIKCAKALNSKYGFKYIYIPEKYKVKDPSDYSKEYGLEETRILIEELING